MYTINGLNLKYILPDGQARLILDDVSVAIHANDSIGILGASGEGKTQLVQTIARINEYHGGVISCTSNAYITALGERWDLGNKGQMLAFRKSEIGYIFQEPFLYFNPTIKIGKQLLLSSQAIKTDKSLLKKWVNKVGLEDDDRMLNSYPHQLSGGQLQRLAIVGCMLKNPRMVIADEITASLDPPASKLILDLLVSLKKEFGFALLWVTHDEKQAIQYCARIWVVARGKLVADIASKDYPIQVFEIEKTSTLPGNKEVLLSLSNVHKSYPQKRGFFSGGLDRHKVLKGISMTLRKGETLGIMGPSGGGKSTLGKIIAGIETWEQGEIYFNSRRHTPGLGMIKAILYLFQDAFSSLNPQMVCHALLDEALEAGHQQVDRKLLLSLARLDEIILNKKARELSGGLRQRFALARALAANPDILIMDESLNALDIPLQKQIVEMLIQYQKNTQISILFISHQMDVMRAFTDRILYLEDGVLGDWTG